jgi:putative ABC transport system permease protein
MLRHYLSLAFRHVARNGLYAGITVVGLAAGFAAAILIALYVRDEYSFERFISGYEQIYRLETDVLAAGQEPMRGDTAAGSATAYLALDFPELEGVVRLARSSRWVGRDKAETWERAARGLDRPRLLRDAALSGFRRRPGRGVARPQWLGAHATSGAQVLRRGRAYRRDAADTGPGRR